MLALRTDVPVRHTLMSYSLVHVKNIYLCDAAAGKQVWYQDMDWVQKGIQ